MGVRAEPSKMAATSHMVLLELKLKLGQMSHISSAP